MSTGPRTAEGKERASRNALRHGLTSDKVVLPGESLAAYEEFRDSFFEQYQPANPGEIRALNRMIDSEWRLTRARRVHTAFFAQRIAEIQRENPGVDYDTASAMLFSLKDEMKRMQLMLRYVTAEERAFCKAQKDFETAVKQRSMAENPAKQTQAQFVSKSRESDYMSPAEMLAFEREMLAEIAVRQAVESAKASDKASETENKAA